MMASLGLSGSDLSDRNVTHARRWAARLCLASDEREARRTLWEAFFELGFEGIAGLRWNAAGDASVLWRTLGEPASLPGDRPPVTGWQALDRFHLGVKIWVNRRSGSLPCDGRPAAGTDSCSDFGPLRDAFGHSPWRVLLSVPHHMHDQRFSVGAASTAPFEECREGIGTIRFLSNLYFGLRSGQWQESGCNSDTRPSLTGKQIVCLRWAVAGKSYKDIADIVGLSDRTVRFHLDNARKHYGFATITQALVQAAKDFDLDPYDARKSQGI